MKSLGIRVVRIGEFAWSRIEPLPGQYDWGWLNRIMALLHEAGLQVVLGTPTATPPAWLVEAHPELLAVDAAGRVREFGSRRQHAGQFALCHALWGGAVAIGFAIRGAAIVWAGSVAAGGLRLLAVSICWV